jgi:hypothetical protein
VSRWAKSLAIEERVRDAHLEHFCPGGAGVPLTSSGPIGLEPGAAAPITVLSNETGAAGQDCGRCGQVIALRQDARRRVSGVWVHETCPA